MGRSPLTRSLWLVQATIAVSCAVSCSVDRETQITVALQSETEVPAELDSFVVRVTAMRTSEVRFQQEYPARTGKEFPTTLAVVPADEDSLGSPVKIEIEGKRQNATVLTRTSIASYVEGRNLLLAMPLRMACFQFKDCGAGFTCRGGQCVTAEDTPLVDYDAKYISPDTAGCFDEEKCLATKTEVTVAEDCTFAIATAEPVNVAIRWAAAPNRLLALDSGDKQEGWTRLSADRGQLSTGACDSHFQRKDEKGVLKVSDWAKQIYVTTGCTAKSGLVPYCRSATTGHAGIGAASPDVSK